MIGGKMIGHRPISTSQHHPGAQRRQLRTGAIEAEQGQRGHGGRKPGKGMNLATSPQNECENRRRRPSRGLAHTPGTPIFALFRWTSERAASIRCPDGGSGQGSFASFLKGPLPPSGHRIERGTIDLQSDINCLPERSLLGAFGKQHDDYDHDVFNSAGSTLATPHFGPENGVHLTRTERRFQGSCRPCPPPSLRSARGCPGPILILCVSSSLSLTLYLRAVWESRPGGRSCAHLHIPAFHYRLVLRFPNHVGKHEGKLHPNGQSHKPKSITKTPNKKFISPQPFEALSG